jgi:haloalkane dehalogenase
MARHSTVRTVAASLVLVLLAACGSNAEDASPASDAAVTSVTEASDVATMAPATVTTAAPVAVTEPTSPPTEPPAPIACDAELEVMTSDNGVDFVRTPDSCFENLPDWDFEPQYVEIDGLRQAYIDEGPADGDPILLIHGQPTWGYLYRFMIPELVAGGHRVIAMDHVGFGRSDKPVDLDYHSFLNHVDRLDKFITELELDGLTAMADDWGATVALYQWSEKPESFDRFVLANGGLPEPKEAVELPTNPDEVAAAAAQFETQISSVPAQQTSFFDAEGNYLLGGGEVNSDALLPWLSFSRESEAFKPSMIVEAVTYFPLTPEETAAYNAPFPTRVTMAGPRTFPSMFNELIGITTPAKEKLKAYTQPFLVVFGGNDLGVPPEDVRWYAENIAGAQGQAHHMYLDASHFMPDDQGPDAAVRVNQFLADNPLP